ncbi:MAG: hypothetical protein ABW190_14410 [Rhizobacter sp.]
MHILLKSLLPLALCAAFANAQAAVQHCDINGEYVNPNNGNMTAGKTGLMRCRDGEGGRLMREQELKNGVSMGIVRYYDDKGDLKREYSTNERGNRDGRSREYDGKQLVLEENLRNSTNVGITRRWHKNGQLARVTHYSDEGREQAVAEFTSQGKLNALRCGPQPFLAPHADDATWCGHKGTAPVSLYAEDGRVLGTQTYERGERRKSETLWANGKPRDQAEMSREGGVERSYSDTGVQRRERRWVMKDTYRLITLDREFHESGTLVRERQWVPADRGADLVLEQQWYLNGQPRSKQEHSRLDGQATRRETLYHDNGKPSHEGVWFASGRYEHQPRGVHKSFDDAGRLQVERHYDERGRLTREREFDASGQVTRDDALFEDGSRKAFGAR